MERVLGSLRAHVGNRYGCLPSGPSAGVVTPMKCLPFAVRAALSFPFLLYTLEADLNALSPPALVISEGRGRLSD